jgi:amino acid adenylation domain-containing protein
MSAVDTGVAAPQARKELLRRLLEKSVAAENTMSPLQEGMWFVEQLYPANTAYHLPAAFRIRGNLDRGALEHAFRWVVERQPALRTIFSESNGKVQRKVLPPRDPDLPVCAIQTDGDASDTAVLESVRRIAVEFSSKPFHLAHEPLMRARLLQLGADDHVLLFVMHHLVCDAQSIIILMGDLSAAYESFRHGSAPAIAPLPLQYDDFAAAHQRLLKSPRSQELIRYWRELLEDGEFTSAWPEDFARPAVQNFRGERIAATLSPQVLGSLKSLASEQNATLFMILLGAFQAVQSRYTQQGRILTGSPVSLRDLVDAQGVLGLFVNVIPLCTDLRRSGTFRQLLDTVRRAVLEAFQHRDLPFETLVKALGRTRDARRNPIVQTLFAINTGGTDFSLPGLTIDWIDIPKKAVQFDVGLYVSDQGSTVSLALEYNSSLFSAATAQRILRHYQNLLACAAANPDMPLGSLEMLDPSEKAESIRILRGEEATDARQELLHEAIERHAERHPSAVAVIAPDESLTYSELDSRANRLANFLRRTVQRDDVVGVFLDRSARLVTALLGILKAGAAYLPLDPNSPAERLRYMLADAKAKLVITECGLGEMLPETGPRIVLDADNEWRTEDATPPRVELNPANSAYVIYTSGSTGQPKGVINTHAGIVNRLVWMQDEFRLTAADRVLQKTPYTFDVSVWEFFWPLREGACLVMAKPGGHQDPMYLASAVAEHAITTIHFVPSMLQMFLAEPLAAGLPSLRRVICSGEALSAELAATFFRVMKAELYNLYGPTEASVDVTSWHCKGGENPVPIGKPIANLRAYVLDQYLQPLPSGVPGALYLAGVGLARGYVEAQQLTAERFVPDPFAETPGERMYRTGDIARFREDGRIEFLGRADNQVKVRGFRIELGEIEAALRQHPGVRDAAVLAETGTASRLIAYWTPAQAKDTATIENLRGFLKIRLPDYMIPAVWVRLESMPLTASGKLNRRALPQPDADRPGLQCKYAAPQTETERTLAEIWAGALGIERAGIHDNFFELGGDSLMSIRVVSAAAERGLRISLQQLFRNQTIAELASVVDAQSTAAKFEMSAPFSLIPSPDRALLPDDVVDAYPLSLLQAGMFFHSRYDNESDLYHNVTTCRFEGPWDQPAFEQALHELAGAHPVLRTYFVLHGYSTPLQLVRRRVEVPLEGSDLRNLDRAVQDRIVRTHYESERDRKFDITSAPLLRFYIHRLEDGLFQLTWTEHHAILDGWSVAAMLVELFERYAALHTGEAFLQPEIRATYRDAIALEQKAVASAASREYWSRLVSDSEPAALPRRARFRPPIAKRRVQNLDFTIAGHISAALRELARRASVPVKSVLLAGHMKTLSVLSGKTDVVTGLVTNGRPEHGAGDRLLGLFLNIMPLRAQLTGGTWIELAKKVFDAEREMLPHRWFPFPELQGMVNRRDLYESAFNFTHFHVYRRLLEMPQFRVVEFHSFQETNLPLIVNYNLHPVSSEMYLRFDYDPLVFPLDQVEEFGGAYVRTLEAMALNAESSYAGDFCLSAAEKEMVLREWQGKGEQYGPAKLLHEEFRRVAQQYAERDAVVSEGERLTYAALDRKSEDLAQRLADLGVRRESRVGVCLERNARLAVAVLGILKAGGAYVPLDPAYPQERLRYMAADAGLKLVVTESGTDERLPPEVHRLYLDERGGEPVARTARVDGGIADQAAYVIYTSGSTGEPKGVVVSHANVWRLMNALRQRFSFGCDDVWTLFHSYAFDFSVWELWGALLYGGRVVITPYWISRSPEEFFALLKREGVTVLSQTPSAFGELMRVDGEQLSGAEQELELRTVVFGGEALSVEKLRGWMDLHGDRKPKLVNMYGITETTVHVTYREITQADLNEGSASPIGIPIDDLRVYVLDAALNPAPVGVIGEMYVGGGGVARGYLGRPALTASRFLPDPFGGDSGARMYRSGDLGRWIETGELEYMGRADQQVKIRGFRVELGEIEAALAGHPGVEHCAVVLREQAGGPMLAAYYVPRASVALDSSELRHQLALTLPDYMIPHTFTVVDRLPRTINGKLDQASLPEPSVEGVATEQELNLPLTDTERSVAEIWLRVLGLERVGRDQDFFDVGGHSVLAMRIIAEVNSLFGVDVSVRVLFETPTIEAISSQVDRLKRESKPRAAAAIPRRQKRTQNMGV